MPLYYASGEEIRKGDRVVYAGEPAEVEFVITERTGDSTLDWFLEQNPGGGFMINPASFGSLFMTEPDEDLDFVLRKPEEGAGG